MVLSPHLWSSLIFGLMVWIPCYAEPLPAPPPPRMAYSPKNKGDNVAAASGYSAGSGGGGSPGGAGYGAPSGHDNFFMYANVPSDKEYEFGYRRGNDQHFQERYEKGEPYGKFKTKVRWGDKKGGYGEHYYDYNHAPKDNSHEDHGYGGGHGEGHGDGHGDGHDAGGDDGDYGGHSQPVPAIKPVESRPVSVTQTPVLVHKVNPGNINPRHQRQTETHSTPSPKPFKNAKKEKELLGEKLFGKSDLPQLVFDWETGRIVDEKTGRTFVLQPIKA